MLFTLTLYLLLLRSWFYRNLEHLFSHLFHFAHTSYFCAVFIEAKGFYGFIAGGLFFMSLLALILHFDQD